MIYFCLSQAIESKPTQLTELPPRGEQADPHVCSPEKVSSFVGKMTWLPSLLFWFWKNRKRWKPRDQCGKLQGAVEQWFISEMGYISYEHKQCPGKQHRKSQCGLFQSLLYGGSTHPTGNLQEMGRAGLQHPSQNGGWITFSLVLIWVEGVRMWRNSHKRCLHSAGKGTHQINLMLLLASRTGQWMLHQAWHPGHVVQHCHHGSNFP